MAASKSFGVVLMQNALKAECYTAAAALECAISHTLRRSIHLSHAPPHLATIHSSPPRRLRL
jgi:hypothetical protein